MNEFNLERPPEGIAGDETDISLRAYFLRMSDERLGEFNPSWNDEEVMAWDGNFRSDGALMLVCCERDVEVAEYRAVLAEHLARRGLAPQGRAPPGGGPASNHERNAGKKRRDAVDAERSRGPLPPA